MNRLDQLKAEARDHVLREIALRALWGQEPLSQAGLVDLALDAMQDMNAREEQRPRRPVFYQ